MVKLKVALETLTKAQLADIAKKMATTINLNKNKDEIIDNLCTELTNHARLEKIADGFDSKDIEVIRLFLKQKKFRYAGMNQGEFAKFLTLNQRMSNSFSACVNKLNQLALIFTNVDAKVVFPSEYLKFFDDFLNEKE
jgi:hypothetical protein